MTVTTERGVGKPNEGRAFIVINLNADMSVEVKGYIPNEAMGNMMLLKAKDNLSKQWTEKRIANVNQSGGLLEAQRHFR